MTSVYFRVLRNEYARKMLYNVIIGTLDNIHMTIAPNMYKIRHGLTEENQGAKEFLGWKYKKPGKVERFVEKYYSKIISKIESKSLIWLIIYTGGN